MKLQLQSKDKQIKQELQNNTFKNIKTQYIIGGGLQMQFDTFNNKVYFKDTLNGTQYYINAKTGDTDLNMTLEGKTVNNMTINNLNSSSILLNATDGNQYNIETDIKTTDQEQAVQDDRLDTLEEAMKHLFSNLPKYVTPQILYGQYFYSVNNFLYLKDYDYDDINKIYYKSYNIYIANQQVQSLYPNFIYDNNYCYIPGLQNTNQQYLGYNQYVQGYPKNLSTTYTQPITFLNNTNFYEGGIFFFLTQKNNQILHFNEYKFDLVQINPGCIYSNTIKDLYQNFESLNLDYSVSDNTYQFTNYNKFNDNVGVFICLTRTGDFDLSKLTYSGSQITEINRKQYDSQFFKDQILVAYKPETFQNQTVDFQNQANTYCITLQKTDLTANIYTYDKTDYNDAIEIYQCKLNFDYEELVQQVDQMEIDIKSLQTFQQTQTATNTDFNTRITTNTNNISTNTTSIQTVNNRVTTLQNDVTANTAGILYNTQQINTIKEEQTTQNTDITNLQNDINQINIDQQTQDDTIADIQVDVSLNTRNITDTTQIVNDNCVKYTDILDVLNSTSTVDALSANKGCDLQNQITQQNTDINSALSLARSNFGDIQNIQNNYVNKSFLLGEIKQMLYQGNSTFSIGDYVFMICNGQKVSQISYPKYFTTYGQYTPNLNETFLQGYNLSSNDITTHGYNFKTLTVAQIPAHAHWIDLTTASSGTHTHSIITRCNKSGSKGISQLGDTIGSAEDGFINSAGEHKHVLQGSTQYKGDGATIDFRPKYFNVCYYICVKTP